ncbi:MAG: hypothetical protein ACXABY_20465 [Candidatus Thorarchaeota archaeon]|jgi:hypothetical protein
MASEFGILGQNMGTVGRWSRLVVGLGFLILGAIILVWNVSLAYYAQTIIFFLIIVTIYIAAHYLLGERVLAKRNPWVGTAILVGPMLYLVFSAYLGIGIGQFIGMADIDWPLSTAAIIYVGVSFLIIWRTGYGGCEVVGIPNILFRRSYRTYCIPLVLVDVLEKRRIDLKLTDPAE